MGKVRMTHPDLDEEIVVETSAEPIHANSGWRRAPGQDDIPAEEIPPDAQRFDGQEQVRMRHPDLAEIIVVGRAAVPMHRSVGWLEVEEEAKAELEDKTVADLKEEARKRGLQVSGTKDELVERIRTYDTEEQSSEGVAGDQPADKESEE
jgi:SAP domain